jgi:hypothetical protein
MAWGGINPSSGVFALAVDAAVIATLLWRGLVAISTGAEVAAPYPLHGVATSSTQPERWTTSGRTGAAAAERARAASAEQPVEGGR